MSIKYLEDIKVGDKFSSSKEYLVTKKEIMEYAQKWDPNIYHIDEDVAQESMFNGLIAPASLVIAIESWLWHTTDNKPALVCGLGWDEVRFITPVRPDDRLTMDFECFDVRPSESMPDCGIIRTNLRISNQNGEPALTLKDSYLIKRRIP